MVRFDKKLRFSLTSDLQIDSASLRPPVKTAFPYRLLDFVVMLGPLHSSAGQTRLTAQIAELALKITLF